jgi:hypothetical protein
MMLFPSIEFNAYKSTGKYWSLTTTFRGTLATAGGGGAADEKERCFSSVCGPNGKVYRFRPPFRVLPDPGTRSCRIYPRRSSCKAKLYAPLWRPFWMSLWLGTVLWFLITRTMGGGFEHKKKRFVIRFSQRDETLKLSLQLNSRTPAPLELLSEMEVEIRNVFPLLEISRFEFYDTDLKSFHQVEDEESLSRIFNTNFMQVLVIEPPPAVGEAILQIEGRAFDLPDGLYINNILLPIQELHIGREQGTGLNTWDGAVVLAKYLETTKGQEIIQKKCVLEVGAGTGTAGLASLYLGSAMVALTDLPYTLDNLRDNTHRALEIFRNGSSSVWSTDPLSEQAIAHVLPLDWSDPLTYFAPSSIAPSLPAHWDVILGLSVSVSLCFSLPLFLDLIKLRRC